MAISQTAEYALRAVVWMAQHPGQPQTTQQLSESTQVPLSYLPKVLHPLIRRGLINGQRGVGGGYSLESDPSAITVLDVVNCVDPIQRIESCPLELSTHGLRLCPLHRLLNEATRSVEQIFGRTTIEQLLADPTGREVRPLCETQAKRLAERRSQEPPKRGRRPKNPPPEADGGMRLPTLDN